MPAVATAKGVLYGWSVGETGWGDSMNESLRRIDAALDPVFGQNRASTVGLAYGYKGGPYINDLGALVVAADGSIMLPASMTVYIERDAAGLVSQNSAGFTTGRYPMAVVLTSGVDITTVTDYRTNGRKLGGGISVGTSVTTSDINARTIRVVGPTATPAFVLQDTSTGASYVISAEAAGLQIFGASASVLIAPGLVVAGPVAVVGTLDVSSSVFVLGNIQVPVNGKISFGSGAANARLRANGATPVVVEVVRADETLYADFRARFLFSTEGAAFDRDVFIGTPTGPTRNLFIDRAAEQLGYLTFRTGTVNRWSVLVNAATEFGANTGSDFRIDSYSDAGVYIRTSLEIIRSTGHAQFSNDVVAFGVVRAAGLQAVVAGATEVQNRIQNASRFIYNYLTGDGQSYGLFDSTAGAIRYRYSIADNRFEIYGVAPTLLNVGAVVGGSINVTSAGGFAIGAQAGRRRLQFDSTSQAYLYRDDNTVAGLGLGRLDATSAVVAGQGVTGRTSGTLSAGSAVIDCVAGNSHRRVLNGNVTTVTLNNAEVGSYHTIELVQDASGTRTVAWTPGSTIIWTGGAAPVLTTTANRKDIVCLYCVAANRFNAWTVALDIPDTT